MGYGFQLVGLVDYYRPARCTEWFLRKEVFDLADLGDTIAGIVIDGHKIGTNRRQRGRQKPEFLIYLLEELLRGTRNNENGREH